MVCRLRSTARRRNLGGWWCLVLWGLTQRLPLQRLKWQMGGSRLKIQSGVQACVRKRHAQETPVHCASYSPSRRRSSPLWDVLMIYKRPPSHQRECRHVFCCSQTGFGHTPTYASVYSERNKLKKKKGEKREKRKRILKKKKCSVSLWRSWAGREREGVKAATSTRQAKHIKMALKNQQHWTLKPQVEERVGTLAPSRLSDELIHSSDSSILRLSCLSIWFMLHHYDIFFSSKIDFVLSYVTFVTGMSIHFSLLWISGMICKYMLYNFQKRFSMAIIQLTDLKNVIQKIQISMLYDINLHSF